MSRLSLLYWDRLGLAGLCLTWLNQAKSSWLGLHEAAVLCLPTQQQAQPDISVLELT